MNVKKNLIELFQYVDALGWFKGINIFAKVKLNRTNQINLNGIKYPFKLRSKSSDVNTFRQVFIFKEYNFAVDRDPKFIIDGGSNIGLAAIYFANRFPGATIASIEPESGNFELLKVNTGKYPAITPVKSGIWSSSAFLKVIDRGLGHWGFVVEEHQQEDKDTFRAVSIGDILNQFNKAEIDILKLDVEGAEKEIFTKNYQEWLPKTKVLVVELHDRMKKGCSKAFFKALIDYDFTVEQLGENMVCYRDKPPGEPSKSVTSQ